MVTIAEAIQVLTELGEVLDDAYWYASTLENKDRIYNVLSCLHHEINELNKLSIQDHHYPYELITQGLCRVAPSLSQFLDHCESMVLRTNSQLRLREALNQTQKILRDQSRVQGDFD